jgi:hypothetical protein
MPKPNVSEKLAELIGPLLGCEGCLGPRPHARGGMRGGGFGVRLAETVEQRGVTHISDRVYGLWWF